MSKVISLGAIAMDIVLETSMLPKDDGFALITKEEILPGGSASNVAVTLANYGVEVYQTGKIGTDEVGKEFRKTLVADGVSDKYLVTKENGVSLHTYIMIAPEGKHCIFANLGDSITNLEPEDIPDDIMEHVDCFYTDMFAPRASIHLAKMARAKNIPVVYNMQCVPSFMKMCGIEFQQLEEMIGLSDLLISGRDGCYELTKEADYKKAIKQIWESYQTPAGMICTAGEEGTTWYTGDTFIQQSAFPINPVDTTGAGDCFIGGFIYAYYCKHQNREDSLKFGNASAAVKCLQSGPRSKAKYKKVYQFMQEN